MRYRNTLLIVALLAAVLVAGFAAPAAAQSVALNRPPHFSLLMSATGVEVYESEAGNEFVQVIDLSRGARLELWHGRIVDPGVGQGVYGGNSPSMERHYLPEVWEVASAGQPEVVCVANGQFFKDTINGMWVNPTELAFPLKRDGVLISEGYERGRFRAHRQMLELWPDHAQISPLTRGDLYASSAPNLIVGLSEEAWVRGSEALGRTFVGTADGDGDGRHERLLLYSGAEATQRQAGATLRAFGAVDLMMLDGGGSTQLLCGGHSYISQIRPLPQTLLTIPAADTNVERQSQFLELLQYNLSRLRYRLCCVGVAP